MQDLLRKIPKVDELLRQPELSGLDMPPTELREAVRRELEDLRESILSGNVDALPDVRTLCCFIRRRADMAAVASLRRVINGTGVVLHTNLGRACLSRRAVEAVTAVARGYSTLEYDVQSGSRGSRHSHVETLLCKLTGAEAAMVVNNNAAAVLLILSDVGKGGQVIASRGELVEIGGSFRIPEIMMQCGCTLKEVGATNKTHLHDYEDAICEETKALLKVHTSNYKIVGFTESVSLEDMVALGRKHGLPVIEDLGSGLMLDLEPLGIHGEPTISRSVKAGVDMISFSGDKLLGGPQAGIILGRKTYIERLKKHPLARAVRVDKMTLAALEQTLYSYLDPKMAFAEIPTLAMLSADCTQLHEKAALLQQALAQQGIVAELVQTDDQVGGGSVPTQTLPTWAVAPDCGKWTVDQLEEQLRQRQVPVIGRISHGRYLLDVRTLQEDDFAGIVQSLKEVLA